MALTKFFRTPKGLLTIILAALVIPSAWVEGLRLVAPGLLSGVAAAAALDVVLMRWQRRAWEFPSGAVLTGLLVAMVLSPHEPWYLTAATCVVAILTKYVFRVGPANVFNPAALAIVVTTPIFGSGESWWGALPELPAIALVALFATGVFIADRVNKLPMVLAFLGPYCLLFTATAFLGDPRTVAEIFRAPDLHAALFFAFFILTDPPTSPVAYRDQLVCGVLVAVVSYGIFETLGAADYLLVGVLVGNGWEGWRRRRVRARRAAPRMTLA
jgi:Na+-translocating ferredoxin:NAD+ oxidoreductase RnfD subunit